MCRPKGINAALAFSVRENPKGVYRGIMWIIRECFVRNKLTQRDLIEFEVFYPVADVIFLGFVICDGTPIAVHARKSAKPREHDVAFALRGVRAQSTLN